MKNVLRILVLLLAILVSCKKENVKKTGPQTEKKDTIVVKFPTSVKLFKKDSKDEDFQLSFRDSIHNRFLYCYGNFNQDSTPKSIYSIHIQNDGSDTVYRYILNRYLQIEYCYYSVMGVNSSEVLHFDNVSDIGNNVVLHEYNWDTKEDLPLHISNIRRNGTDYSIADTFIYNTAGLINNRLQSKKIKKPALKAEKLIPKHPRVSVINENSFFNDLAANRKKFFEKFTTNKGLIKTQDKAEVFKTYTSVNPLFKALITNNITIERFNEALASVEKPLSRVQMTYAKKPSYGSDLTDKITSTDLSERIKPVPFILRDGVITKELKNERGYDYYAVTLNATLFVQRTLWTWQAVASKKDTVFDIPYLSAKHKMIIQGGETFDLHLRSMERFSAVPVPPDFGPLHVPWGGYGSKGENRGGYIKVPIKMNIMYALSSNTFYVSNIPGLYEVRFGVTAIVGYSSNGGPRLADYEESNAIIVNYFENNSQ